MYDKRDRKAGTEFYERLAGVQRNINGLKELRMSGNRYSVNPQNIMFIQEPEEDHKRVQNNIVLRAVKTFKPEIYERKNRRKEINELERKPCHLALEGGKIRGQLSCIIRRIK